MRRVPLMAIGLLVVSSQSVFAQTDADEAYDSDTPQAPSESEEDAPTAEATKPLVAKSDGSASAVDESDIDGPDEVEPPPTAAFHSVNTRPNPPPRPAPLPPTEADPPVWKPRIEVGGDVVFVSRPAGVDLEGGESGVAYGAAVGFGLHAAWSIFDYLRFTAYFLDAKHSLDYAQNALDQGGTLTSPSMASFSLGAKLSPTWPWTPTFRSWVTVGAGWGRYEFDRATVEQADGRTYEIRERDTSFVELPFGLGSSLDVIPQWLSVGFEVTAAPVFEEEGTAFTRFQSIDPDGRKVDVGGYPLAHLHLVQTLSISLLL